MISLQPHYLDSPTKCPKAKEMCYKPNLVPLSVQLHVVSLATERQTHLHIHYNLKSLQMCSGCTITMRIQGYEPLGTFDSCLGELCCQVNTKREDNEDREEKVLALTRMPPCHGRMDSQVREERAY